MVIEGIKELLGEYEIKLITEQNYEQVMEIYNTNQEYFMIVEGTVATIDNCLEDLHEVPTNFELENKFFISFWKDGSIVAVLDFLIGHPNESCIWIGLLLVHGELHGNNIGGKIARTLLEVCKEKGYASVQLGVIDNNKKALAFWEYLGFAEIREVKVERENRIDWNVIVMEKRI